MNKEKTCFKCNEKKQLCDFYKHSEMKDGHLNKCKVCTKKDNKTSNGIHKRMCVVCDKQFHTTASEINRGGGNCCSRKCWHIHFPKIVKRNEESPWWKGKDVGKEGLHCWVKRQLGTPRHCEICNTTTAKFFDWANLSQKYRRDIKDYKRMCRMCHIKYDMSHPLSKKYKP